MTPGRLVGAAVAALLLTSVVTGVFDPDAGSALGVALGLVILGAAGAAVVGLVWLPFDIARRRRRRRDARFAEIDTRPEPEEPSVWIIDGPGSTEVGEHDPDQLVTLREFDGPRVMLARIDTSEDYDPAPPVGTEVIMVAGGHDDTVELFNAATFYERNVALEDDWIVLAHVLEEYDVDDSTVAATTPEAPPSWPSA